MKQRTDNFPSPHPVQNLNKDEKAAFQYLLPAQMTPKRTTSLSRFRDSIKWTGEANTFATCCVARTHCLVLEDLLNSRYCWLLFSVTVSQHVLSTSLSSFVLLRRYLPSLSSLWEIKHQLTEASLKPFWVGEGDYNTESSNSWGWKGALKVI